VTLRKRCALVLSAAVSWKKGNVSFSALTPYAATSSPVLISIDKQRGSQGVGKQSQGKKVEATTMDISDNQQAPDNIEELNAFLEYLELNEDIQAKLDHALACVDKAKGYVGELRTASAIFRASLDHLQEQIKLCAVTT
jgi:hypothetical protein